MSYNEAPEEYERHDPREETKAELLRLIEMLDNIDGNGVVTSYQLDAIHKASDLLRSLLTSQPQAQEVWQWVPKEPTDEMWRAAFDGLFASVEAKDRIKKAYDRMLAAAPQPPEQSAQQEPPRSDT